MWNITIYIFLCLLLKYSSQIVIVKIFRKIYSQNLKLIYKEYLTNYVFINKFILIKKVISLKVLIKISVFTHRDKLLISQIYSYKFS